MNSILHTTCANVLNMHYVSIIENEHEVSELGEGSICQDVMLRCGDDVGSFNKIISSQKGLTFMITFTMANEE